VTEELEFLETRLKHILIAGDDKDSVAAARVLVEIYKLKAWREGMESPPPQNPEELIEAVREMMKEAGYEIVPIDRH
jgi:hypothetical protein